MTDAAYRTFPYRFAHDGISSRYVYDRVPPGRFLDLQNLESRQEGTLSTRYELADLSTNRITKFPLRA